MRRPSWGIASRFVGALAGLLITSAVATSLFWIFQASPSTEQASTIAKRVAESSSITEETPRDWPTQPASLRVTLDPPVNMDTAAKDLKADGLDVDERFSDELLVDFGTQLAVVDGERLTVYPDRRVASTSIHVLVGTTGFWLLWRRTRRSPCTSSLRRKLLVAVTAPPVIVGAGFWLMLVIVRPPDVVLDVVFLVTFPLFWVGLWGPFSALGAVVVALLQWRRRPI